uniref:Uncharacterized protein n=1 Tax=Picea glauca TaxID=3330 RepID=A0A101M2W1_PICGL|nr:hypothetical protein ABT39_MTgene3192 [Picea glauca]QHR88212.1 hypothetical protein Q903MT_gene2225 [Picea sitchensis]
MFSGKNSLSDLELPYPSVLYRYCISRVRSLFLPSQRMLRHRVCLPIISLIEALDAKQGQGAIFDSVPSNAKMLSAQG